MTAEYHVCRQAGKKLTNLCWCTSVVLAQHPTTTADCGHRVRNRVSQISLFDLNNSELEKVPAAIQDSIPELTYPTLHSREETVPLLPDSFLDGTTPRLEYLELACIHFRVY